MAVPGWPIFACWTASMASVRMVLIDSCSMSVLATKLLVQALLSFPSRTLCLCPAFLHLEHLSEGRLGRLVTGPFQGGNGRTAERRLLDGGLGDRPAEGIGHDLDPGRVVAKASTGGDDGPDLGQEFRDRGDAERHALERGPAEIGRRRLEGQAGHGARRIRIPAGRALAAEEGQKGEPVLITARAILAECPVEPDAEVPSVRERTTLDDAPPVQEVEKETRPGTGSIGLVEDPQRGRGADGESGARAEAAGAEIRADAVDPDREVAELRQSPGVEPESVEQLLVPGAAAEIEEAGARGERQARHRLASQVLGK